MCSAWKPPLAHALQRALDTTKSSMLTSNVTSAAYSVPGGHATDEPSGVMTAPATTASSGLQPLRVRLCVAPKGHATHSSTASPDTVLNVPSGHSVHCSTSVPLVPLTRPR